MENTNPNEVTNNKEITCVADFLYVLQNEVNPINKTKKEKQIERFYRGLSKTEYLEKDYPSIYRTPKDEVSKKNGKRVIYDPYIKYEHKMFYDLVSRFPEQFSSCKNTFEHLVMMQHYEFPTRLLDVTSNPLVALYFSCVDKYGNVDNKDEKGKYVDGAVTIYDIPNELIKNYNSDTVTILSNLARISTEYLPFYSIFNKNMKLIDSLYKGAVNKYHIRALLKLSKNIIELIEQYDFFNINEGFIKDQNKKDHLKKRCNIIIGLVNEYDLIDNSMEKKN